jgi:tetrapyrrole methylase family protein/MazG family protein
VIVIVGLGPGNPDLLTREAWRVLSAAGHVFLRTRKHPTIVGLPKGPKLRSFDALYDRARSFDAVYTEIADTVVAAARRASNGRGSRPVDVVYAVPGHPLVGERSVPMILERARAAGIAVRIVAGVSFLEPVLETLALAGRPLDALDGVQLCDALDLTIAHHPPLNPDKPALIAQVYARHVASDLKLTLMNQYPPGHIVHIVRGGAHSPGHQALEDAVLAELDHRDTFDHLTSLLVPAMPRVFSFEGLQETIAHLRAPEGCPWDQEQTHQSLRVTLLEEAYEVLTAIDEDDMPALKEELGDLLLNVILQAQIATEAEDFRMGDVVAEVDAKLKRRHPHIFGDAIARTASDVNAQWQQIKQQEKAAKGIATRSASVLDGIAPALPALAQAQKIAHRADRAGFRWKDARKRYDKVLEELAEIRAARGKAHRQEEFGDLIFTIAYWADGFGIDIETAARAANAKFTRRFRALEQLLRDEDRDMSRMSEAALLAAWRRVKGKDGGRRMADGR